MSGSARDRTRSRTERRYVFRSPAISRSMLSPTSRRGGLAVLGAGDQQAALGERAQQQVRERLDRLLLDQVRVHQVLSAACTSASP